MREPTVTKRSVVEHGWLRRPELDGRGYETWERPDGMLYAAQPGTRPVLLTPGWRDGRDA